MPNLEFECRGEELSAVPKAYGWGEGEEVDDEREDSNEAPDRVSGAKGLHAAGLWIDYEGKRTDCVCVH